MTDKSAAARRGKGWIEWKGEPRCPVPLGTKVEIELRDGRRYEWEQGHRRPRWHHRGHFDDIVAYRLLSKIPPHVRIWEEGCCRMVPAAPDYKRDGVNIEITPKMISGAIRARQRALLTGQDERKAMAAAIIAALKQSEVAGAIEDIARTDDDW